MRVTYTFTNLIYQLIHLKFNVCTVDYHQLRIPYLLKFLIDWKMKLIITRIHIISFALRLISLSAGLLWELWPLVHGPEPAAPPHRGPLHPPAAAGLAHPHRPEDGAANVHEQVHLRCPQVFWALTLHSDPTRLSFAKKRNISSQTIHTVFLLISPFSRHPLMSLFSACVNEVF